MKKQWSLAGFTEPYMKDVERIMDSADWSDPETYGNWLAQTYYYVCHSTRLLAAAASRSYVDRDNLHVQQMNHMSEERNHERLAAADLKSVGLSMDRFPELTSTKNLYRSTYFLIERVNPICMYGYVYFLEALSLRRGNKVMEAAKGAFGDGAVRYLKLHASEDEGHIKGYEKVIEALSAEDRALVEEGLVTAAKNYERMVEEVKATSGARSSRRAA